MNTPFMTCLTREAKNKEFRVLAEEGGFRKVIDDLMRRPQGELYITAQRGYDQIHLKIFVDKTDEVSRSESNYRFDGCYADILDVDGGSTGNMVRITLGIDTAVSISGGTVGVLRMEPALDLPTTA